MHLSSDLSRHVDRFYGKYSGQVTSVSDPDQMGRVMVKVPSVLDPEVAVWARPCFAPGHFFVPAVGAHVWVEFEAGDVGFPLWVGTWYPQGTVPAGADKKDAVERLVHTPSGHVIELSDESGKEQVVIRHKLDAFVSIDKDGSILAANQKGAYLYLNADKAQVTLTSEQGHLITLDDHGVMAVEQAGARVEISKGKVKISGPKAVQIVADEVSLAAGSLSLGASATSPAVLGDGLMAMFNAHVHLSTPPGGSTGIPVAPLVPGPPVFSTSVKVQK